MEIVSIKYDYDKEEYVVNHYTTNINGAKGVKSTSFKELSLEMKAFISGSTVIQTEDSTVYY